MKKKYFFLLLIYLLCAFDTQAQLYVKLQGGGNYLNSKIKLDQSGKVSKNGLFNGIKPHWQVFAGYLKITKLREQNIAFGGEIGYAQRNMNFGVNIQGNKLSMPFQTQEFSLAGRLDILDISQKFAFIILPKLSYNNLSVINVIDADYTNQNNQLFYTMHSSQKIDGIFGYGINIGFEYAFKFAKKKIMGVKTWKAKIWREVKIGANAGYSTLINDVYFMEITHSEKNMNYQRSFMSNKLTLFEGNVYLSYTFGRKSFKNPMTNNRKN